MTKTLDRTSRDAHLTMASELAENLDDMRETAHTKMEQLDDVVYDARANGAKFREIAAATGRSTSWVQAALGRATQRRGPLYSRGDD